MPQHDINSSTDVIASDQVVNAARPQPIPVGHGAPPAATTVDPIRDGNLIRMLKVRCSCGQLIQIVCDYEQQNEQ